VLGLTIRWYNARRSEESIPLPRRLAGYVRYGVGNRVALHLLRRGVRSRLIAVRVAREFLASDAGLSGREWVTTMSISRWQRLFDADRDELRELVEYARLQGTSLLASLLDAGEVQIPVRVRVSHEGDVEGSLVARRYLQSEWPTFVIGRRSVG